MYTVEYSKLRILCIYASIRPTKSRSSVVTGTYKYLNHLVKVCIRENLRSGTLNFSASYPVSVLRLLPKNVICTLHTCTGSMVMQARELPRPRATGGASQLHPSISASYCHDRLADPKLPHRQRSRLAWIAFLHTSVLNN